MLKIDQYFYKGRIALNVLAKDQENAKEIFHEAKGHVLIGVLSKDYEDVPEATQAMKAYDEAVNGAVSVGLGGGDSRQSSIVAHIAKNYPAAHINQVFPAIGQTRAYAGEQSWINGLVSPSGKIGYVNISTGTISEQEEKQAIVPIEAAIALIKDMGGQAIKYFPLTALDHLDEYKAVAEACGREGFFLEPTGGIDVENFTEIVKIALEAGVPKIIPHIYSSIIDKETGLTNLSDVRSLFQQMKTLVDTYE